MGSILHETGIFFNRIKFSVNIDFGDKVELKNYILKFEVQNWILNILNSTQFFNFKLKINNGKFYKTAKLIKNDKFLSKKKNKRNFQVKNSRFLILNEKAKIQTRKLQI